MFLNNFRELEQFQNEKRKALLEHEHTKLVEIDERLKAELRDWKEQLVPRKQVRCKYYQQISFNYNKTKNLLYINSIVIKR